MKIKDESIILLNVFGCNNYKVCWEFVCKWNKVFVLMSSVSVGSEVYLLLVFNFDECKFFFFVIVLMYFFDNVIIFFFKYLDCDCFLFSCIWMRYIF